MQNDLTTNKLIILYVLNKIHVPIYSSDLINFILENDFCDYFYIKEQIGNLLKSNLIKSIEQNQNILYYITDLGSQTINYFINRITKSNIDIADKFCDTIINNKENLLLYRSNIIENYEDSVTIFCSIYENDSEIFNICLPNKTYEEAKDIAENWNLHGKDIYNFVREKLY